MKKVWVSVKELKKQWNLQNHDILHVIECGELHPYSPARKPLAAKYVLDRGSSSFTQIDPDWPRLENVLFKIDDLPEYENSDLNAKEKRELGQLRKDKEKWDDSIKATVIALEYCKNSDRRVLKKDLSDCLSQNGFNLPETTFRKIWDAIPQDYRHTGGRPPKK